MTGAITALYRFVTIAITALYRFVCHFIATIYSLAYNQKRNFYQDGALGGIRRGIQGSIRNGSIRVLFFNGELRMADHYLRPLAVSFINI